MFEQVALPFEEQGEDRFAGLTPKDIGQHEVNTLLSLALAILTHRHRPGQSLTSPDQTRAYLRLMLTDRKAEVFCCLFLDNRHRLLSFEELFFGSTDGAAVYPRELVRRALELNAAAVILAHNHPSGEPEPSSADQRVTVRLKESLSLFDIRLLDHFVVGAEGVVSFAERGLL